MTIRASGRSPAPPFCPYGWMHYGKSDPLALPKPDRFCNDDGTPADDAAWRTWLEAQTDLLTRLLWPRWRNGGWDGDLAAGEALTRADLDLMPELAGHLDQPIAGTTVNHRSMFVAEDSEPPRAAALLIYAPDTEPLLLRRFTDLLLEGGRALAAPPSLELKHRMQRPRPYQIAFLLNPGKAFKYEVAHTATTPSMVSGHCLQGSMALVNIVVRFEHLIGRQLEPKALGNLQRFLIDGGDRRVFAGVHYPSDNVSSWLTALRLCRHFVFDETTDPVKIRAERSRARDVLWSAIKDKSIVYEAMLKAAKVDGSPFAAILSALENEAEAPLETIAT